MVGHRIDSQTGEIYHHSNQLFDHFFLSTNVNVLKQAIHSTAGCETTHSTAGCETTHYINPTKSCITAEYRAIRRKSFHFAQRMENPNPLERRIDRSECL
eukprot:769982_1